MPVDTNELEHIVRHILSEFHEDERWPSDIIDRVFSKIYESEHVYLRLYKQIAGYDKATQKYDRPTQQTVNQTIGKLVKEQTKLETIQESVPAELGKDLIQTYTELGPAPNGTD
jgi:hypothetical protein